MRTLAEGVHQLKGFPPHAINVYVETARPAVAKGRGPALLAKMKMPPPHPVARRLREGDAVGDFVVLDVPGHSPGHIALWRASDRTLVVGDVF
jgi:hydroxyacylglutathione hydrolase